MRFRGKSIRRKIVALLLVPLVSLSVIWAFSAAATAREVQAMLDIRQVTDQLGHPVKDTVQALQAERRQALVHLADPHRPHALTELGKREKATDRAVEQLRANAQDPKTRENMQPDALALADAMLQKLDDLDSLRRRVAHTTTTRNDAYTAYTATIAPCYDFLSTLEPLDDVEMDEQAQALVDLSRAREALSREDALLSAAFTAGQMNEAEMRSFTEAVAERRLLYRLSLPILSEEDRAAYEAYWQGPDGSGLRAAEDAVIWEGSVAAPRGVEAADWHDTADTVLADLDRLGTETGERFQDRLRPHAVRILATAGAAGGLGLVAVVVSVLVSVRIGRSLIRDLSGLRREALEASGTRLPRVMRRLAAGERIDIETEAPRLRYADDEVGQVGQALDILQRAAVEAAVRQADMRRGVSDVFVNLARRSQVLLHRQLTLLDTMERRTEDAQELADLFRLDHMTTRMRRHAEGLVILSGAVPSRQWRNPVQLMDVVRAAVAEVEEYKRVEVRRLPRVAVVGAAVADITHLVAELIENATVFSPPHTSVHVHGEVVPNGFVLEIDDRGLGLTPEALLEANLRLAETPEFELSDTDRLGLFVVSRLAQRQGVRVSLRPSPYGGTTAVVLIPRKLLTEATEATEDTAASPAGGTAPAAEVETTFRTWGLAAAGNVPEQHQQAVDPLPAGDDPLPRRRRTPVLVADRGRPVGGSAANRPRPEPVTGDTRDRASAARPAGSPAPVGKLPRRIRQASLAPQLRVDRPEEREGGAPAQEAEQVWQLSAEEVRARMASMQRGWQRGREHTEDSTAPRTTPEGNGR